MNRLLTAGWILALATPSGAVVAEAPPTSTPAHASVAPQDPLPVHPPAAATLDPHLDVPFVVKLAGPGAPSSREEIEIRIVIERQLISPAPMRLSLELPPGVELVRGEREAVIVDEETGRIERTVRIAIRDQLPSTDLIVTVDQRGEGWGAHATQAYRFGRPEPKLAPLERDERPVILDGKNYGRPILLR